MSFLSLQGQTDLFKVDVKNLKMDAKGNAFFQSMKANSYFYEDENYTVTDSCRGEFGGSVYFKNKRTGITSFVQATCPLVINKINSSYYLTTSLSHLSGSWGFYEISNPEDLVRISEHEDYSETYRKWRSKIGTKVLYESIGSVIIASFIYKNQIYHIVSDQESTYLAKRKNAEMVKVQELLKYRVYSYLNKVKKTEANHYLGIFQTSENQGYVDIFENQISIVIYE